MKRHKSVKVSNQVTFSLDKDKSVAVILFILNTLGHADIHKLCKIIYFADQKHLSRYGKPITGDWYVAMKDGPVPSNIYDFIKIVRGDSYYVDPFLQEVFEIKHSYMAVPKQPADINELSESELVCLNESIQENRDLPYDILVNKSHDEAYLKANKNNKIAFEDIALCGGANEEMLKYITATVENIRISSL
jgi:uncharacterized phage-associated protein